MIILNCLLGDIGKYGIGAAECHNRHLAEEHRDVTEDISAAEDGE